MKIYRQNTPNDHKFSICLDVMQSHPLHMSVFACVYTYGITLVYIFRARPLLPTLFLFSPSCILPELSKVHLWWPCHDLDPQTHLCCQNMVATSRRWTATSLSGVQCDNSVTPVSALITSDEAVFTVMEVVQVSFSTRNVLNPNFHNCRGCVMLVHSCFGAGNISQY